MAASASGRKRGGGITSLYNLRLTRSHSRSSHHWQGRVQQRRGQVLHSDIRESIRPDHCRIARLDPFKYIFSHEGGRLVSLRCRVRRFGVRSPTKESKRGDTCHRSAAQLGVRMKLRGYAIELLWRPIGTNGEYLR